MGREAAAATDGGQAQRAGMLKVRGLTKTFRFRDTVNQALKDVDLDIDEGEFFVLLGPSGCGKTTMLRSIAGLEQPEQGDISIDGATVFSTQSGAFVSPDRRPIAMVFQSYAIWPHMNVYENIAFPLRQGVQKLDRATIGDRVEEVLVLLGLNGMDERPVTTLSGGQQQRVALARALALRPKVLLMDEPLSNLDYKLQIRLRSELRALMHRLGLTTVYVTHNQAEALEIGDKIAVMDHGRIIQMGNPRDIYHSPHDEFVARFIGDMNLVPARVHGFENGHAVLETALGRLAARTSAGGPTAGQTCFLGVRPEDVLILGNGESASGNSARGRAVASQYTGEAVIYTVQIGDVPIRVKAHHSLDIEDGAPVVVELPSHHCTAVRPMSTGGGAVLDDEDVGITSVISGGAGPSGARPDAD